MFNFFTRLSLLSLEQLIIIIKVQKTENGLGRCVCIKRGQQNIIVIVYEKERLLVLKYSYFETSERKAHKKAVSARYWILFQRQTCIMHKNVIFSIPLLYIVYHLYSRCIQTLAPHRWLCFERRCLRIERHARKWYSFHAMGFDCSQPTSTQ